VFATELAMSILPFGSIHQGCFDAFHHGALSQSLHGGPTHLDRLGDPVVTPARPVRAFIGHKQDPGAHDATSRGLPFHDRLMEDQSLGI
jgi:hypothetical protein